jgi:RNA polymerase sigma-70 factor (ECF subfamily)
MSQSDQLPDDLDVDSIVRLIPLACEGNLNARSEICRQVQGQLEVLAKAQIDERFKTKIAASDIVQLTMTRMINGIADFRGATKAEFYAWLTAILKNEIRSGRRNLLRDRRDARREQSLIDERGQLIDPVASLATPGTNAIRKEKLERFKQAINKLPPDYATVIELRGLQELPFQQVAERMNRTVDAVSKLFSRALIKLHEELNQIDDSQVRP